jgi:hypothetical protein
MPALPWLEPSARRDSTSFMFVSFVEGPPQDRRLIV